MTQNEEVRPDGGPDALNTIKTAHNDTPSIADRSVIEEYLTGLYGTNPDGLIWIGAFELADGTKKGAGKTFDTCADAATYAIRLDTAMINGQPFRGVYHRATTLARTPERHSRGDAADSAAAYLFALDVDLKGPGHKKDNLPATREETEKVLKMAGAPEPTAWIFSGGGYYPQWRFPDPIDLRDTEQREHVAGQFKEMSERFKAAAFGLGWHLDSVHDLARVFRIPGTVNRKTEPVMARLEGGTGAAVGIGTLRSSLRKLDPPAEVKPAPVAEELFDNAEESGPGAPITRDKNGYPVPPLEYLNGAPMTKEWCKEHLAQPTVNRFRERFEPGNYNVAINEFAFNMAQYRLAFPKEKSLKTLEKVIREKTDWSGPDATDLTSFDSGWDAGQAKGRWAASFLDSSGTVVHLAREDQTEAQSPEIAESWKPRDISAVLNGTYTMPQPDLGFREDGQPMLYSGKEHSIASEPECGKTWWVLMQVRSVLAGGGNVVYVDFEDDEGTIVGRLHHVLGVAAEDLGSDRFRYVRPEGKPTPAQYAALLDFSPALVVLDGVTEGMSLLDLEIKDNGHAAVWRKVFVKPATGAGAATLSTDHVVKDRDSRGRFAIGGGHKLAGLTGAMFKLEQVHPFGKGLRGVSRVLCSKDRNGGLRPLGQSTRDPGITYMGDLVGDCTEGRADWHFYAPRPADEGLEDGLMPPEKIRDAVLKVKRFLEKNPGAGTNTVEANVEGQSSRIGQALTWLVSNGQAEMTLGARNSKTYRLTGSRDEE